MNKPVWWPPNPYPEDIFLTTRQEAVEMLRSAFNDDQITGICAALGRIVWQNASDLIFEAVNNRLEQSLNVRRGQDSKEASVVMRLIRAIQNYMASVEKECPHCEMNIDVAPCTCAPSEEEQELTDAIAQVLKEGEWL